MRKIVTIMAALGVVIGAGVFATTANADVVHGSSQDCTPADAVIAVEEVSHMETVVDEPAVEEVSHTEWKYSKHGGEGFVWLNNDTFKYVDKDGNGYDKWWEVPLHKYPFYERTQNTRVVIDVEAKPAVTHEVKVIDVEAVEGREAILCEWYTWDTNAWTPDATDAATVNWPQTLVGAGQIEPTVCETTYQQDLYRGTRAEIDAILDGSELTHGEDFGAVKAWVVVSTDECLPDVASASITIAPATCTDGETLFINEPVNASLHEQSTQNGTEGPGEYGVRFVANEGALFEAGTGVNEDRDKLTFTGTLAGPLDPSSPECLVSEEPTPEPTVTPDPEPTSEAPAPTPAKHDPSYTG